MEKEAPTKHHLTQSQLSLWTGQRMHSHSPLHNVVYTFEIWGEIDGMRFQEAFARLVEETDILRLAFDEEGGIPFQYVKASAEQELELVDFRSKGDSNETKEWISARTQKTMQLTESVYDSVLIRLGKAHYVWFLKLHHLVTDAISNLVLYNRMDALYREAVSGIPHTKTNGASFDDYLTDKDSKLINIDREESKNYWQQFAENAPDLPKLYGQTNKQTTTAERVTIELGEHRNAQLREIAKRQEIRGWTENLSLFSIFATVFAIFQYRVSGQQNLAIGAPAHNRDERRFQKTAGLFISVFPFLVEIEEDDNFLTVLQRVKMAGNTYLHHARTGTQPADIGKAFNSVLNFITVRFPDFNDFPTRSEWIHPGHMDSTHAIRFHVHDFNGQGMQLSFDLNTSVFPDTIAQQVPGHYLRLLDAFIEDVHQSIDKVGLLGPEEKRMLFSGPNAQLADTPNIVSAFESKVEQHPNAVAVQSGVKTFTYRGLNDKVNQLAHYLIDQGIGKNDKVAVHLRRGTDYLISVLAVLKSGAAFIPIASDQAAKRVSFIVSDSGCSLVLSENVLKEKLDTDILSKTKVLDDTPSIFQGNSANPALQVEPDNLAYVLYTSGSTGSPKGVAVSHKAIANYLQWAAGYYKIDQKSAFPLFTSIGFDLTLTSTLLPLVNGGRVVVYQEKDRGPDFSIMQVLADNQVDVIKLTPSHLALLNQKSIVTSAIKTVIVGGEDLKTGLANKTLSVLGENVKVYNEYGPTEATIGCIVTEFDPERHTDISVPIGKPIANMKPYILDKCLNHVPQGVIGELYLSGIGLAEGYNNDMALTESAFLDNPFSDRIKMYRTGDLARINTSGEFEYLGRIDDQVKLRGHRIELADIEANLASFPDIENCSVIMAKDRRSVPEEEVVNCISCGLPSNYPEIEFNHQGVCQLCTAFENYEHKVDRYFKNDDELVRVLTSKRAENRQYDCISLLSGGKDSTYVLARLVNMGLKVLAFTMDNGYISDQAKANIDRIVTELAVDHVYGETPHMDAIFVDSLHRHHNVCNGCFKTIYTLSTQIALEKNIPFIVTGLSRGQFFETRLTEELFWKDELDTSKIDDTILEARKLYHREQDAVKELLDVSAFEDDTTFEKVQFIDFYRYSDVSLEEMLSFLDKKVGWVRPTDTGRSTNCLINQVGIYVHKKEEGYSNYAFPYSWDVRLGHKKREESLEEINEAIDETEVRRIMKEIGYEGPEHGRENGDQLVAYFTGNRETSLKALREFLSQRLPSYMVPTKFMFMESLPLTKNGKVDKKALLGLQAAQLDSDTPYTAPRNEIEELLESIWKEVLLLPRIGVHDDFIALGGHSLAAIRVTARINEAIEVDFPLSKVFEYSTIAEYAGFIETTLTQLLEG